MKHSLNRLYKDLAYVTGKRSSHFGFKMPTSRYKRRRLFTIGGLAALGLAGMYLNRDYIRKRYNIRFGENTFK